MRTISTVVIFLTFCGIAHADWVVVGAAYKCNQTDRTFVLTATAEASYELPRSNEISGYTQLPDGETEINCKLPVAKVSTKVVIWPPQARGMCHGIGVINFSGLSINGEQAVPPENFGDGCFNDPTLARIEVIAGKKDITVRKCYETEISGDLQCSDSTFSPVSR